MQIASLCLAIIVAIMYLLLISVPLRSKGPYCFAAAFVLLIAQSIFHHTSAWAAFSLSASAVFIIGIVLLRTEIVEKSIEVRRELDQSHQELERLREQFASEDYLLFLRLSKAAEDRVAASKQQGD